MAEIMQLAGDEGEGIGTYGFKDLNVVIWTGMSEELVIVMRDSQANKLAHIHPSPQTLAGVPMVYFMDGEWLNMPLAKKLPKNRYAKPHWFPVVFYPGYKCYSHDLRAECPNYRKGDADRERSNVVAEQEETRRVLVELAKEYEGHG